MIEATFDHGLEGVAWAAPQSPTGRLEWELLPHWLLFDGVVLEQGASTASLTGATVVFAEAVTDLADLERFHWRARLRTNNPLRPVTPWIDLPWNTPAEAKVRTLPEKKPIWFQ